MRMGSGLALVFMSFAIAFVVKTIFQFDWDCGRFSSPFDIGFALKWVIIVVLFVAVEIWNIDMAYWRVFGREVLKINADGIEYTKQNRLIRRRRFIKMEDMLAVEKYPNENQSDIANKSDSTVLIEGLVMMLDRRTWSIAREDQGRILIKFRKTIFGHEFTDQIDVGVGFYDEDVENVVKAFAQSFSVHSSQCTVHS